MKLAVNSFYKPASGYFLRQAARMEVVITRATMNKDEV